MLYNFRALCSFFYKKKSYTGSILIGTTFFAALPAYAQEKHPLFMPKRDVTVVYAVQPENSSLAQKRKIYFSGNGTLFRIDGPNNIGFTLIDSAKQTATVVSNKSRVYTVIPSKSGKGGLFLDESLHFRKKGTDRILGILCHHWSVQGTKGHSDVCVTDEGILLRQEGMDIDGIDGKTEALSVQFDALSPSIFQVPVGYQQVRLPQQKGESPTLVSPNANAQPLSPIQAKKSENGNKVDASQNPFITPQRDVDVVYAIAGPMPGLPPFHQRMRWSVEQWKQRIDSQGIDTYMITDYRTQRLTVLNPQLKKKTELVAPGASIQGMGKRAEGDYVKVGEATVAGQFCNEWEVADTEGNINDVCYTNDGVMLRVVRNNIPLVVALKVVYAHQDAGLYKIPSDLKMLAPAHP